MKIAIALKDNGRVEVADLESFLRAIRVARATGGTSEGRPGPSITVERDDETAHTGLIYEHEENTK